MSNPLSGIVPSKVTLVREALLLNAPHPISYTAEGMITLVREQPENACLAIPVILEGMVTLMTPALENAPGTIDTPWVTVTVKFVQPAKASDEALALPE